MHDVTVQGVAGTGEPGVALEQLAQDRQRVVALLTGGGGHEPCTGPSGRGRDGLLGTGPERCISTWPRVQARGHVVSRQDQSQRATGHPDVRCAPCGAAANEAGGHRGADSPSTRSGSPDTTLRAPSSCQPFHPRARSSDFQGFQRSISDSTAVAFRASAKSRFVANVTCHEQPMDNLPSESRSCEGRDPSPVYSDATVISRLRRGPGNGARPDRRRREMFTITQRRSPMTALIGPGSGRLDTLTCRRRALALRYRR
jgi:hypothetical protein